ncbi:MAG: hypothetical protein PHH73_00270 [Candidatus Rickettsiella isopodorum]|nr:hypothetical protein [Candidatus Rickettsiella isopodorum]
MNCDNDCKECNIKVGKKQKSRCCNADVKIGGDDREGTHYYICTKCGEDCDLRIEEQKTIEEIIKKNCPYNRWDRAKREFLQWHSQEKIKMLDGLKREYSINPYSKNIFTPLTDDEYKKINELLKKEMGFSLDKLSGNILRIGFEGWTNSFKQKIEELKNDR